MAYGDDFLGLSVVGRDHTLTVYGDDFLGQSFVTISQFCAAVTHCSAMRAFLEMKM